MRLGFLRPFRARPTGGTQTRGVAPGYSPAALQAAFRLKAQLRPGLGSGSRVCAIHPAALQAAFRLKAEPQSTPPLCVLAFRLQGRVHAVPRSRAA